MMTMRLLEERGTLDWEYDAEADVLYLSLGEPRPGVGMDIGDGLVIRYDEGVGEVLGLTVIGLQRRIAEGLGSGD